MRLFCIFQMVKRSDHGREESDLDRIQDLFPSDHLRLHERDPLSPVSKFCVTFKRLFFPCKHTYTLKKNSLINI